MENVIKTIKTFFGLVGAKTSGKCLAITAASRTGVQRWMIVPKLSSAYSMMIAGDAGVSEALVTRTESDLENSIRDFYKYGGNYHLHAIGVACAELSLYAISHYYKKVKANDIDQEVREVMVSDYARAILSADAEKVIHPPDSPESMHLLRVGGRILGVLPDKVTVRLCTAVAVLGPEVFYSYVMAVHNFYFESCESMDASEDMNSFVVRYLTTVDKKEPCRQ